MLRADADIRLMQMSGIPDPTGVPSGYRLTITGDGQFDWRQQKDDEIIVGHGDPNGAHVAPKGSLYVDVDAPGLWQNVDGLSTWTDAGTPGADGASGAIGTYTTASPTTTQTVDFATAQVWKLTLGGNVTITLTGAVTGSAYGLTIYLVQDATGVRTVTWPASVKWPNGVPAVLSTAANAVDVVVLESWDGGTTWFANLAGKHYA